MSYLKKIEYEIITESSFSVIRNCAGCNKKTNFQNTNRFRVNANGNKLDVWLIYQCERCKHTFNLTIYEREKPSLVPPSEYRGFLDNDEQLAETYGKYLPFFKKNKAEVDFQNVNYHIEKRKEEICNDTDKQQILIQILNPHGLKIRSEKQISETLNLSRSQVKKLIENEEIKIVDSSPQSLTIVMSNHIEIR